MSRQERTPKMVVQLEDVSAILADVQRAIGRIVQGIKSSDTALKLEPIHVRKRRRICASSDESSVEQRAIADGGSISMEDGLSESGKFFTQQSVFTFQ